MTSLAVLALFGCARAASSPHSTAGARPRSIDGDHQVALRQALATRDSVGMGSAIDAMPGDTVLRLLTWGLARHRLGQYEASNRALQEADKLAEARYTQSVRQQVGTALLNDNAADYIPGAHERAFIHYYGMLNYLQLGQEEDALIEARSANQFLARYSRENGSRSFTIDGTVEYLAGLLHLGANDRNDAIISFRKANLAYASYQRHYGVAAPRFVGVDLARIATRMGAEDILQSTTRSFNLTPADIGTHPGHGQLLVLVENGSVARRVEEKVYIPVLESEANALKQGGAEAALTVGLPVALRTLLLFDEASNSTQSYGHPYQDGMLLGGVSAGADFVTMAWPRYVLDPNAAKDIVVIADSSRQPAQLMEDLSAIAARGFEEERPRVMKRMVFRGLAKYAMAKAAEKQGEDKGGAMLGFITKLVAQGVAARTESADIRSWSALPGEIRAARFSLPAGSHQLSIEVRDADGTPHTIDLGTVKIVANKVAVRSQFVTGNWSGATERFASATRKVNYKAAQDTASGIALADNLANDALPKSAFSGHGRSTDFVVEAQGSPSRAGRVKKRQQPASKAGTRAATSPRPAKAP